MSHDRNSKTVKDLRQHQKISGVAAVQGQEAAGRISVKDFNLGSFP